MPPTLQIQLLGDFRLVHDGALVTSVNTARLQSLLAYLLLHRHAPQPRQQIAFALWPDSSEARASGSLRKLLHQLAGALPGAETFLGVDRHALQWRLAAPYALDVAAFEDSAAGTANADALRRAADLYHGDLLPGCYDDWIVPERERLRQLFTSTLQGLGLLLESRREYRSAIQCAQRLLQHDSLREETYRHLMRLHALSGDRAGAVRTFHACATALERELGVEPSLATREEFERLLNAEAPARAATLALLAASPLVGRAPEWSQLQSAWRSAAAGAARFALLSGTAGIGKTRLAEELLEWARRQGIATAHAFAHAAEGALAFAPVASWLRARPLPPLAPHWKSELARLLPELLTNEPGLAPPPPVSEAWQRGHLFEALARALLPARQALLLVIDDLQWCDRDTLEWLHFLLRFDPRARLLVLGTARSEEISADHPLSALVAALQRSAQVTEIELAPLDSSETAALAGNILGGPLAPALAARLFRETEGNALFVVEMTRSDRSGAAAAQDSGTARLPPTMQAVIRARLAQLSPAARELAGVAAAIGREFSFGVLQQATGESEDALVRGLDELWQRRIVREHGLEAYDFSHEKLRDVAYADLGAARRRVLHRRVAAALEASHPAGREALSGQIAAHYDRAALPEQAIPYYERAALAARRVYANQEAISLFRRALALIARLPQAGAWADRAVQLFQALGDVLEHTAAHAEARAAYRDALQQVPEQAALLEAQLQRRLANTYKAEWHDAEAWQFYALAEAALDRVRESGGPPWWEEWVNLQFDGFALQYWRADLAAMVQLAEKVKPVVEQHGTIFQRAQMYRLLSHTNMRRDRYAISDETLAYERAAFAAIEQSGDSNRLNAGRFQSGFVLLWRGLLDEAEAQLLGALNWHEQVGEIYEKALVLTYLTILHRKRGEVARVSHYALAALETATAAGMSPYIATAKANLAWVAWKTGNMAEAETEAQAALDLWSGTYPFQWTALMPLISIALKRGRTAQAARFARALFEARQQRLPDPLQASFEAGIQCWARREKVNARSEFAQAMQLSQQLGYL